MIEPSASLHADDVCIRCRVRRSPYARNPEFSRVQEMVCTMRSWEPTSKPGGNNDENGKSSRDGANPDPLDTSLHRQITPKASSTTTSFLGGSNQHGPELLLCPIHSSLPKVSSSSSLPLLNSSNVEAEHAGHAVNRRFLSFGSTPSIATPAVDCAPSSRQSSASSSSSDGHRSRAGSIGGRRRMKGRRCSTSELESPTTAANAPIQKKNRLPPRRGSTAFAFGSASKADDAGQHDLTCLQSYAIPISDVLVVDVGGSQPTTNEDDGEDSSQEDKYHLSITTNSKGYFKLSFDNKNSHDVLLAFLKSSLPKERVTVGLDRNSTLPPTGTSAEIPSFDMDNFTAQEMKERFRTESVSEKLRRRVALLMERLGEFSDCVCCVDTTDTASTAQKTKRGLEGREIHRSDTPETLCEEASGPQEAAGDPDPPRGPPQAILSYEESTKSAGHHEHHKVEFKFDNGVEPSIGKPQKGASFRKSVGLDCGMSFESASCSSRSHTSEASKKALEKAIEETD